MNAARTFRWPMPLVLAASTLCFGFGFAAARWKTPAPSAAPQEETATAATTRTRTETIGATAPAALSWDERWQEKKARPVCPSSTRDRAKLLEELARTDPQRALKLALAESNLLVRDQLRDAALRGWAAVAPDDAAGWAMAQPVMGERMRCVSAVLAGAAENPSEAIRVALKACSSDPTPAGDYGHSLINALVERTGDFKAAVDFATKAGMVDRQSFLLDSAYYQWAQHEPKRALEEIASITDPAVRESAMKGVIEGCADSDARKLADYAKELPEGEDRNRILAIALPEWVNKDPDAVLKWINESDPDPAFDRGIATIAKLQSLVESHPDVSMDISDNITDPVQRSLTKSDIFIRWARQDYEAAERYALSLQNPDYRDMFLQDLHTVALGNQP